MPQKTRVALVGCGSVSQYYLPDLAACPLAELVAVCDIFAERARSSGEKFGIPQWFEDFDGMLDAVTFDLLVNTTNMQNHARYNLAALSAGRNVWCEKPIATTLPEAETLMETAERRGVRLWGAPNTVLSPAFAAMNDTVQSGEVGKVCAAHARYGHGGDLWSPWFFQKGGGSLFDLGVYNVTTLTGLLGPVKEVVALSGVAVPVRTVHGEEVRVEADDNTMVLMDFGDWVYAHVQTGFVYRAYKNPVGIEVCGTKGTINLLGHDWQPQGVEVWTEAAKRWETRAEDQRDYVWQSGASHIAACLAEGREPIVTPQHAFHVLEVMLSALESAATGRRIAVTSAFPYPLPT